jgi:hypothetical protein
VCDEIDPIKSKKKIKSQAVKREDFFFNWEPWKGGWERMRVCAVLDTGQSLICDGRAGVCSGMSLAPLQGA